MAGNVDDRGPVVLAVTIAMLVISSFFIILRFVSRIGIVRRVGWDDYTILIAWVPTLLQYKLGLSVLTDYSL